MNSIPDGDGQIVKVYISAQPGYPEDPDYCYLLTRTLYVIPNAARTWFTTMSKFLKTDAEFFKTNSRVAFVHKCSQDSSVPEPLRQEYIIRYQRICAEPVVNAAPVHMFRWEPYEVVLQTMNHKCRKAPGVPDHFTTANDLLNWLQAGTRLFFVNPSCFSSGVSTRVTPSSITPVPRQTLFLQKRGTSSSPRRANCSRHP